MNLSVKQLKKSVNQMIAITQLEPGLTGLICSLLTRFLLLSTYHRHDSFNYLTLIILDSDFSEIH